MLHHFLKNAILLILLNVGVKGLYLLGVEREVQNVLPSGQYGLYFSLFNFSMLLQLVADFGLQLYNSRNLAGHHHLLRKYFPYFLSLKLSLGVFFLAVLMTGGWLLGYREATFGLLLIVGVNQLLMSFLLFVRSNLTGTGRYRADSWISVVDKVLMLLLVGGLLLFARDQLSVYHFALAQTMGWVLSLLIALTLLFSSSPSTPRDSSSPVTVLWPRWNPVIMYSLLRKSAPFALAVFLMTAYTRTDAIMIERLLPDGDLRADHYAAAYRLLDAVNMLGYLLSGLLLPMFSRLIKRKEPIIDLLRLSLPTVLAGSLLLSLPLAIWAEPLTAALYDFADPRTGRILSLLIFSFVAMCANYVYGALLGAADELKRMNVIFAIGCLLNLVGNYLVVYQYGAVGVAAVTLLTQSFIALAQAFLAHRRLRIARRALPLGRLLFFSVAVTILNLSLLPWLPASWWVKILAGVAIGILLAFLTRVWNLNQWLQLLRRRDAEVV